MAGRWEDEKKWRQHVRTSCTPPEAYRPLFTVTCHTNSRRVKLHCLRRCQRCGRDSEKRLHFSAVCSRQCVNVVCEYARTYVCSTSPLSQVKEKRGGGSVLLSAFCSTGFLLKRGKDASCLKPGTLFEHVLSSPSIFLLRRGTSNDILK